MKNCVFCKYFNFIQGDYGYSEYTPGWDAVINCYKSHWQIDMMEDSTTSFREYMASAIDCKDFTPDEFAIRKGYINE